MTREYMRVSVAQRVEQVAHREAGDVDAQGLVEPERRALDEPQHDAGGDHGTHGDGGDPGGDPGRTAGLRGGGTVVDVVVDQGAHEARIVAMRPGPAVIPPTGAARVSGAT